MGELKQNNVEATLSLEEKKGKPVRQAVSTHQTTHPGKVRNGQEKHPSNLTINVYNMLLLFYSMTK